MENLRQEVLDVIENISIPNDLVDIEVPFVPMRNEVLLLKIYKGERKSTSGMLIIPEFEQSSQPVGRIVALGPKCQSYLKKGLLVMFNPFTAQSVSISGVEYNIVEDFTGIKGIIVDEKKVEVVTEPISPETIKRRERIERNNRIQKDMNQEFDNTIDKIHEVAKFEEKNPTTSNRKRK